MITLNLLPPERRALIRQTQRLTATRRLSLTVLAVVLVVSLLHGLGLRMLKAEMETQKRAATAAQANFATDESKALAADIKSINTRSKLLADLKPRDRSWGILVADFIATVPGGVSLSQLSLNQLDRAVVMAGSASTREDLLAFKNALLAGKFVDAFETPLSDLTKREAIPFSVTTHVPVETIDRYRRSP
jgi:Tfp pilus assembly protein PilN